MANTQKLLITGVDTGVGKTFVAAGLTAALREKGAFVGVYKPVQSGFFDNDARSDAAILAKAAGGAQSMREVCPYRFHAPVAPQLAAQMENRRIDIGVIYDCFEELQKRFELVVVEGAGGLLAPLGPDWTILDMAARYKMPAIIVVANRLGCLNHALLTERALRAEGISVLGFVLNNIGGGGDESVASNAQMLSRLSGAPVWGPLNRCDAARPEIDHAKKAVEKAVDLDFLMTALKG